MASGPSSPTFVIGGSATGLEQGFPIKSGKLRKKSSKINQWGDRYFSLHNAALSYYQKKTDTVSRTNAI
jgi:hypothetical protein